MIQSASNAIQAPKSAFIVYVTTILTGVGEALKVIPWGEIAAAVGIISTIIMGGIQIARFMMDWDENRDNRKMRRLKREKEHLEIEALKDAADQRHNDDL